MNRDLTDYLKCMKFNNGEGTGEMNFESTNGMLHFAAAVNLLESFLRKTNRHRPTIHMSSHRRVYIYIYMWEYTCDPESSSSRVSVAFTHSSFIHLKYKSISKLRFCRIAIGHSKWHFSSAQFWETLHFDPVCLTCTANRQNGGGEGGGDCDISGWGYVGLGWAALASALKGEYHSRIVC